MKKQRWLVACLILSIFVEKKSKAQPVSTVEKFDPIVDLRSPRSLFEDLHTGINGIYASLQSGLDSRADLLSLLQSAENELNDLSNMYDSMINTTRAHRVHHDDKEFLQKMIDRITSMIDELEGSSDTYEEADENIQSELRSVRSVCDTFKAKISF